MNQRQIALWRRTIMGLAVVGSLSGCSSAENAVRSPASATPAQSTALALAPTPAPATPSLPPAAGATLPAGWTAVAWEGLLVALPPDHIWEDNLGPDQSGLPGKMLASAAFHADTHGQHVLELPYVNFRVIEFQGSLEEWLDQAHAANPAAVAQTTIQQTTLLDQPALRYIPLVTGGGYTTLFLTRLDAGRLLLIAGDTTVPGDSGPPTTFEQSLELLRRQ